MSNLRDSISERNFDVSRPSTSQVPAPQSLRSKSSHNNKMKDKISSKISTSHSATERQKHPQNESTMTTRVFRNSSVSDVSAQCQNLNINSESDDVDPSNNPSNPRKKNAKKREKLKALKITPSQLNTQQNFVPNMHQSSPQVSTGDMTPLIPLVSVAPHLVLQNPAGYIVSTQAASVHDFFFSQVSPLYMNSTSRYVENLCYHPQYQYSLQMREMVQRQAVSMPSTPLVPRLQRPNSGSIPNSPECNNTPRHLQNILQHPLLRQSFSRENQAHNLFTSRQNSSPNSPASAENGDNKSPRRRSKKKMNDASLDEKKFDPYLSAEEVEKGLQDDTFLEGVLRINPKQFLLAYVSSSDRTEQDILIEGMKNRNRGLEGDVVIVQYILDNEPDENNKQKKGKVIYIKEKVHTRTCIGVLKLMPDRNRQKALFVPRDHRIPRLNIPFSSWPDNFYKDAKSYENTLFLAKIVEWTDTRFAIGKMLCNIGQSGDMMSETKAILAQTDLDITPFGPELRDLYPRLDYVIPEEEIKLREDCRSLCLFSIDPSNCRDIDDAVSCRKLCNGNFEIGVHISDVAHFLTENTLLDEKVAEKATTIYLVERAYHMLPDDLCMLCSLFPGVDKLAFSVFWEITKDAKVLSHRFSKTVIHSCCQLAYEHAQAILDDNENSETDFPETYNGFQYKDIYETIKILGSISSILRKNRFDGGALRIDQPKVSFRLNPTNGLPSSFTIYDSKESHQLIEEFMLLANMTVAARIEEDHPKLAFLRCHPPPSAYMLQQLAKSLKPMGIDLNIDSAGNLHRSLLPYTESETERGRAMVLNMLCAKPMARAKYFCAGGCEDGDYHHYALNVPIYTHFTSPIRRYADIMVHRLLAASLKFRDTPKWEVDKVRFVAAQCNKQKYNAKKAGELSTELYTLKYIELNSPVKTEAVVVDVREKYIDVIIVVMGLNRRIFFNNDFPGEYKCIKNEAGAKLSKMILTWRAGDAAPQVEQVIEVFSILEVEMIKGDDMVKVETRLVRPL